jgi:S-adenosylmethionine synthetase
MMPLPIWLAHRLTRRLDVVRRERLLPYLAPEGKAQVGVAFSNRAPLRIHSIHVIASQQEPNIPPLAALQQEVRELVIDAVFEDEPIRPDHHTRIEVNFGGMIVKGGPSVHSGLTGRKGAEDMYGEYARHSQIALSGKDPSRVGRTGSYAARYAAKNVVAAGLADECEVQLSYAMGSASPISIQVDTSGTGKRPDSDIAALLRRHVDFRIAALIRTLELRFQPAHYPDGFYRKLATYGHIGRTDIELPWEVIDLKNQLQ